MTLTAKESMQHISPDQIRDKPRNAAQPHSPALQGNVYFFFFVGTQFFEEPAFNMHEKKNPFLIPSSLYKQIQRITFL